MPLKLLLDENLRADAIWHAVLQHQASGDAPLDIVRVGNAPAPALSARDSQILEWAAGEERIVSHDLSTLPALLAAFLAPGRRIPGVILLRSGLKVPQIVDLLVLVTYASSADEWENRCTWQP
jgi:hypothetical protein